MTVKELLAEANALIVRLTPAEALAAAGDGALLVDIRSEAARERDGVIPGAVHVPRTVLEWRLEPGGRWRNPHVGGVERQVIVVCEHGYSSVLAAASLAGLGYASACDVVGGFDAWRDARLPTVQAAARDEERLPGMGPPD